MRTIRIGGGGVAASGATTKAAAPRGDERSFAGSRLAAKFLNSTQRWGGTGYSRAYLEAYKRVPVLRKAVDILANRYSGQEWTLLAPRGEGKKRDIRARLKGAPNPRERQREIFRMRKNAELVEVEESAVRDAFLGGRPGLWSGVERRRLEMVYRLCVGESFGVFERNVTASGGLSYPVGQIVVPPHWVFATPVPGAEYFEMRNRQGQRIQMYGCPGVPMPEVAWRKVLDPMDPAGRGTGLVQALATELETMELGSQHLATRFYNQARPDVLVIGEFGSEDRVFEAEDAWLAANQGVGRAHLPYFVDVARVNDKGQAVGGGALKFEVKEMSTSLRDLQMVELRESLEEVTRMVVGGIPAEIMGKTGQSNRATIEHAWYVLDSSFTVPELEADLRWIEDQLLPLYGEAAEGWLFEYVSPIQEDREYVRQVMTTASHAFTIDEHRQVAGFEPLPNGQGEAHMVGLGATYVRSLSEAGFSAYEQPPAPATPQPAAGGEEVPAAEQAAAALSARRWWRSYEPGAEHQHGHPASRKLAAPAAVKGQLPQNPSLARIAKRLGPRAAKVLLAAVEQAKGQVDQDALAEAVESGDFEQALAGWEAKPDQREKLRRLLGLDALTSGMAKIGPVLRGIMDEVGKSTASHLARQLGEEPTFEVGAKEVRRWLQDRQRGLVQWVEEAAVGMARALLSRDKEAGRAASETASRLREHLGLSAPLSSGVDTQDGDAGERTRARAEAFGQDQAYDASQEGQRAAWTQAKDQGILPAGVLRIWVTQRDDKVCPICYRLDGQERGLDEPFDGFEEDADGDGIAETGAIQLMNPGSEAHAGCRCPVVLSLSDQ